MPIRVSHAATGALLTFSTDGNASRSDKQLSVVVCATKSTVVVRSGLCGMWCVVFGSVEIASDRWTKILSRGDVYVGDLQNTHEVNVSDRGVCVLIVGSPTAWATYSGSPTAKRTQPSVPFPALHRRSGSVCRKALRLARNARIADGAAPERWLTHELTALLTDLQKKFASFIERCAGTSSSTRRSVFMRLQRVRNHIEVCAHEDLDTEQLALLANYSVSHFITIFRLVFGETPYSLVNKHRIDAASGLLTTSDLEICVIARSSGFPNRSAFTRAFKRRLGVCASDIRSRSAAQPTND